MDIQKSVDILRHIVNQEPYHGELTAFDYEVLRDNQISGSMYPIIKHHNHLNKGFKEDYYRYISRDETQNLMIEEIRTIFNQYKIDYIFLKGSYLKHIYPQSFMRTMGDIDILVRYDSMEKVHQVLEDYGFVNWTNSTNHDCFMKNHVNVEIHPKLDSEISNEYQDLFMKPWLYAIHKEHYEYDLVLEYRYFYQIYHMIKHLYHSGVGLRTLIDLYLLSKNLDEKSDKYQVIYKLFPKKEFVKFMKQLIYSVFSKTELFSDIKCDKMKETNEQFIHYMIESGMHGIGENHNLFIGGMAQAHKKHEWVVWTKIKFLFLKAFPSFSQMKGIYLYLKKYPILLPFAYIHRIFKLMFKKSSRRKLSRLQANKELIRDVEKLFIDIGIKN